MTRRCCMCVAVAAVVDEPPPNTGRSDDAWCARHMPKRPPAGWSRIRLTETRAKVTEAKST